MLRSAGCQEVIGHATEGVAASLDAIDCISSAGSQAAFTRLFGGDGALAPALTIILTLAVALFALNLLLGRSRIGLVSLSSTTMRIGLVLTVSTSWMAYETLVWNLFNGAPNELAGILLGTEGDSANIFAAKIDILMRSLQQASGNGTAPATTYSPLGVMWAGGVLLLLGTAGILATTKIALGVLVVLGPIFVSFSLFPGTQDLFAGWLKGLALLAIATLLAVLGGSISLRLAIPMISSLAPTVPGQIDPEVAVGFFVLGASHSALMILALRVATTIVSDWSVFAPPRTSAERSTAAARYQNSSPRSYTAPNFFRRGYEGPSARQLLLSDSHRPLLSQRHLLIKKSDANGSSSLTRDDLHGLATARTPHQGIGSRFSNPTKHTLTGGHNIGPRGALKQ